ncbi:MAG: phosphotransferase [Sphaerochaetaceae bacterium]|nr:phosphotransferase [Sphaerochaetaceae bacterium]
MDFINIFNNFKIDGTLIDYKANNVGHINSTFISKVDNNGKIEKYTHQKINTYVFTKPNEVMSNIDRVTTHIQSKVKGLKSEDNRCLKIIKTNTDQLLYCDDDNNYWRCYKFIDNVKTFQKVNNTKQAYLLGKAVATFQKQLSDFDGNSLFETIVDFHNMGFRYNQLEQAIEQNRVNRASKVKEEIDFLLANKDRGLMIFDLYKNGTLKSRVTHNDTKINNILFSEKEDEALCVIDLDTVMPGTILFDTGDMIRTATSTALEDEIDCSKMKCNIEYFKALIKGYLEIADKFISKVEKDLIVESGRNITQIMAVRFLTDYINGDIYYSTTHASHNIERCRTQIALMKDMDLKWDQLNNCIN